MITRPTIKIGLSGALLMLFIALGPIYWFPGVAVGVLALLKTLLFMIVILAYTLKYSNKSLSIPLPFLWAFWMMITLSLYSSIVHQTPFFTTYIGIFVFYLVGNFISEHEGHETVVGILISATLIFTIFPALVVFDFLAGGVILNPLHESKLFLFQTGFHGGRTGWSVTCNLILAFCFFCLLGPLSKWQGTLLIFVVVISTLNIFVVDSRGGILVAVTLFAIFLYLSFLQSKKRGLLILSCAVIGYAGFLITFGKQLISSRIYTSIVAPEQLQSGLTTGRSDGFSIAVELLSSSPLLGVGDIDMRDFGANAEEVHNVWLRVALEQGLIPLFGLIIFSFVMFNQLADTAGGGKNKGRIYLFFCAGFIPTLFEPTAIFGNYFSTAIFWVFLGALARNKPHKTPYKYNADGFETRCIQ